ncbi:MAG: alpha-2-macroglobulin family protein [Verrucomicrobiota bacterium]
MTFKRKMLRDVLPAIMALVTVATLLSRARTDEEPRPIARKPLTPVTAAAPVPNPLCLMADGNKVLGWIGESESFTDRNVIVTCGDQTDTVTVGDDNTFTWYYDEHEEADVTFSIGDYTQNLRLRPAEQSDPTVFFVVDRTVYRPGHTLQFAAFLRELDKDNEFTALRGRRVKVDIRSANKGTLAKSLKLRSDAFGRIVGEYRFDTNDPLDDYTLSIKGYRGEATVQLAEFRKSKVKLTIDGGVTNNQLHLNFGAVDFLEKPVPGTRVTYSVEITAREPREEGPLSPDAFAFGAGAWLEKMDLSGLGAEERLLVLNGVPTYITSPPRRASLIAKVNDAVQMSEEGVATSSIDLQSDWLTKGYSAVVHGVLLDQNGREQRRTHTISLDRHQSTHLDLSVDQQRFQVGSWIDVKAELFDRKDRPLDASSVVVAMKLRNGPAHAVSPQYFFWSNDLNLNRGLNLRTLPGRRFQPVATPSNILRDLVTAVSVKEGVARIKLTEPGPYSLIAIAQTHSGETIQQDIGITVHHGQDIPTFELRTNKESYPSGETIEGSILGDVQDTRVLLTLRDGTDIHTWQVLTLSEPETRFRLKIPDNASYHSVVGIKYFDLQGALQIRDKRVQVVPTEKLLTIDTELEDQVTPGERTTIDISLNREEEVDLVVSVYDQSLLGIAEDTSTDIRSFYFGDGRADQAALLESLRCRMGGANVHELSTRLDNGINPAVIPIDPSQARRTVQNTKNNHLYLSDVVTLLRSVGIKAVALNHGGHWFCRMNLDEGPHDLLDVMKNEHNQWKLTYGLIGDTLVLAERHPTRNAHGYLPLYSYDYLTPNGGFAARGDAHFSASANAMISHSVSAQSFISHMPTAPVELMESTRAPTGLIRRDFSDSAYFNAKVRTDRHGKARVRFKLPDSLTNWQVVITAVSRDMHVGAHRSSFRTFKPVMVWPMIPRIFTAGDKVELYASVHNRTDKAQNIETAIEAENGTILTPAVQSVKVPAKSSVPVYWTFEAGSSGFLQILMSAKSKVGSDASLKRLPVVACAATEVTTTSGFARDIVTFDVPKDADPALSSVKIELVPSLAADMAGTLPYLVQYPHGCVEQTMSRFLPTIRVAGVFRQYGIENQELEKKVPGYVAAGIKRLLALQRPDGGWAWQGNGRTHEMMTPYAMYGLLEAEKAGYRIGNEKAVERGLKRLGQFINGMGERQAADKIYCMYVVSHRKPIEAAGWTFIESMLKKNKLSDYALAMALEMAAKDGQRKPLADALRKALHKNVKTEGGRHSWTTARFSRWGDDSNEITAAVLKALVAYDSNDKLIPGILDYFAATKKGNRWNSTKDTAMIVYAVCDYLSTRKYYKVANNGCRFSLNEGKPHQVQIDKERAEAITIEGNALRNGENRIRFMTSPDGLMVRTTFSYRREGANIEPTDNGIFVTRRFYQLDEQGGRTQIAPGASVPRGAYILSEITARRRNHHAMQYVLVTGPKPRKSP